MTRLNVNNNDFEKIKRGLYLNPPDNLEQWLDEHGGDLTAMQVLKLLVQHVDKVSEKVRGIAEVNGLWDGS